jgi:hypothetical protein
MRVKVDNFGKVAFGEFVGLLAPTENEEHDSCVVRLDGYGLYLHVLHPSRVRFVTPREEQEAAET